MARRRRIRGADCDVVHVDQQGRARRITASTYKLKTLPNRMRQLADDLIVVGSPVPLPKKLADTSEGLRDLAGWLEKNRPVIPHARLLRGPTAALRLMLTAITATPSAYKRDPAKLAVPLAEVLGVVGNLFDLYLASADAILKLAKRTLTRQT